MTLRGLQVLVVDDEPAIVDAMARLLAYEGVAVVRAGNGAEGLARLAERRFDLVLCDVRMPVMDGPAMLTALRAGAPPHPPLVFLTGYADRSDRELLALGAAAVRGKPLGAAELFELVAAHGAVNDQASSGAPASAAKGAPTSR